MKRVREEKEEEKEEEEEEEEDDEEESLGSGGGRDAGAADASFTRFFRSLPAVDHLVRFFERRYSDRRPYYTVYGDDARMVAQKYYRTLSALRPVGRSSAAAPPPSDAGPLVSQSVSAGLFVDIVRDLLLVARSRVEVYELVGAAASASSSGGHWTLQRAASPGNVAAFEEELFRGADGALVGHHNPALVAVLVAERAGVAGVEVGAAYVDLLTHAVCVAQFLDDAQLSGLEALLLQVNASEVLVARGDSASVRSAAAAAASGGAGGGGGGRAASLAARTEHVLNATGVAVCEKPRADFSAAAALAALAFLLPGDPLQRHPAECAMDLALGALACVAAHMELTQQPALAHKFRLRPLTHGAFFRLRANTIKALNLVSDSSERVRSAKSGGLFAVLNQTCTPLGARTLQRWLLQPLLSVPDIERRQDVVAALVDDVVLRQSLRDRALRRMPDVTRCVAVILRAKLATLEHAVRVYHFVQKLGEVHALLQRYDGAHAAVVREIFVDPLARILRDLEQFQAMVVTMIDLDALGNGQFRVVASFDAGLAEIAKKMSEAEAAMRAEHRRVMRSLDVGEKECLLEHTQALGHYVRVTKKCEKAARGVREYRAVDNTRTSGFKFRNERLSLLNDQYRSSERAYENRQAELVRSILEVAATYTEPLSVAAELVGALDAHAALAHVAATLCYCRPRVLPKEARVLRLRDARHPIVEQRGDYTPNDVELDAERRLLLVTGPNMAGKSTYIRSVGLVVILAQMGSFVPCREAELSVFDAVLCRVGSSDSVIRGVSTFMAEMIETADLLAACGPHSLAIVDELGRGTSTTDGFGIASGVCEYLLRDVGCAALFATHFHELTALAGEYPAAANVHVTAAVAADDSLTFLYKVRPGVCDRSFGVSIARLCQLPAEVVAHAQALAARLEEER